MNNILSEKEYQHFIMDFLRKENGYIVRDAKKFDRLHCHRLGVAASVFE